MNVAVFPSNEVSFSEQHPEFQAFGPVTKSLGQLVDVRRAGRESAVAKSSRKHTRAAPPGHCHRCYYSVRLPRSAGAIPCSSVAIEWMTHSTKTVFALRNRLPLFLRGPPVFRLHIPATTATIGRVGHHFVILRFDVPATAPTPSSNGTRPLQPKPSTAPAEEENRQKHSTTIQQKWLTRDTRTWAGRG